METMKNCKACGAEIAKSAKVCPKCGAKQKKHRVLWIVLAVVVLLGILGAIGGGDSKPTLVASNQNTAASQETAAEPTKDSFGVGDTVALDGVSVTLKSVSESQGANFVKPESGKVFVLCEFEIENNSGSDIAVSSIMSFEAYIDDIPPIWMCLRLWRRAWDSWMERLPPERKCTVSLATLRR